uniref:Protein hunchback n=1 Tax=Panagrellus redivivus TaxID=6233 RepID=A0A7E4WDK1_PANRE
MSYIPDEATWTHLPAHTPVQRTNNFPNVAETVPPAFGEFVPPMSACIPSTEPQTSWHQTVSHVGWTPPQPCNLSPNSEGRHSATSSATSATASPTASKRPSVGPEEFAAMREAKQESEVSGNPTEGPSSSTSKEGEVEPKVEVKASPEPTITAEQQEASQLLLSLSQPAALNSLPTSSASGTPETTPNALSQQQLASLRIEERILNETLAPPAPERALSASAAESIENIVNTVATADFELVYLPDKSNKTPVNTSTDHSGSPPRTGRGFLRAPGLGPCEAGESDETVYTCPVCSFCCRSKFHYNSHMNTHGDHRCSMCDYTSRTEGRLKKHMRESHTRDEQIAAGMDVPPEPVPVSSAGEFSATMASVMDLANRAVAEASDGSAPVAVVNPLDCIRQLTESGNAQMANALNMLANGNAEGDNDHSTGASKANGTPRRASGKQKKYKCKNCDYISLTKEESWGHNKQHIPIDKQLTCQQCEFVTEYKHHLEYHIRNHYGSKPFKCTKCSYSCVNKSMLNSHMKSHSEHYMFQCMDCNYQSKYCHSLKMHLSKYDHRRKPGVSVDVDDAAEAMANPEAIENPDSIPTSYSDSPPGTSATPGAPPTSAPLPTQTPRPEMSAPSTVAMPTPNPMTPVSGISNLLLSPLNQHSAQYASMLRAHQQDQINELMLRAQQAHNQLPAPFNCTMCDFSTNASEAMVQHNVAHFQANAAAAAAAAAPPPPPPPPPPTQSSAALGNIFQYLLHQQPPMQGFTAHDVLLRAGQQLQQQQMALAHPPMVSVPPPTSQPAVSPIIKMEVDVHSPLSPSPEDSSGDRSSSSPADVGSGTDNRSVGSNGSRKRKAKNSVRLEEISARLQGKSSPEDNGMPFNAPTQFAECNMVYFRPGAICYPAEQPLSC